LTAYYQDKNKKLKTEFEKDTHTLRKDQEKDVATIIGIAKVSRARLSKDGEPVLVPSTTQSLPTELKRKLGEA
jgi:hypothetical protein